jgi:hypothetical protein
MTRMPFQPSGYTDGTSEGCKPSPLYTGPRCTCTQPGTQLKIDGELYTAVSIITDAGCPEHGLESAYIRDPHEGASAKGGPKL